MKRLTYTRPHLLAALHQQLIDAGLPPLRCEGGYPDRPDDLALEYPDGVSAAAVAAVVAAHDKAAAQAADDAARRLEADDTTQARQVLAQLTATIDGWPTATNAQKLDATLLCLRVCRVLVRLALRRLGG